MDCNTFLLELAGKKTQRGLNSGMCKAKHSVYSACKSFTNLGNTEQQPGPFHKVTDPKNIKCVKQLQGGVKVCVPFLHSIYNSDSQIRKQIKGYFSLFLFLTQRPDVITEVFNDQKKIHFPFYLLVFGEISIFFH